MPDNRLLTLIAGLLVVSGQGIAADFDGSKPLACAIVEVTECSSGSDCRKTRAEELNLPQFLFINFEKKTISGTRPNEGGQLEAAIMGQISQNGSTILQGAQNGLGWSLALENRTGRMSASVVAQRDGVLLFGSCIPNGG